MLRINSISNVNNTLKNNISFGAGVQTNYGIKSTNDNLVEGSFTGFVGGLVNIIRQDSPLFKQQNVSARAESIKKGLEETNLNKGQALNLIA